MEDEFNIESAQWMVDSLSGENSSIKITIAGEELFVPIAPGNRHYDAIQRQVAAGTLNILEADSA